MKNKKAVLSELLQRKDLQNCSSEFIIWLLDIVGDSIDHYETLRKEEELWKKNLEESILRMLQKELH